MKYRPSSLPMLAQCSRWTADQQTGERDKDNGTTRHHALAHALQGDRTELDAQDDDDRDRLEWALEYVQTHAPTSDHPIRIEQPVSVVDDNFEIIIQGTPDVTCGPELFDLKWRERDYTPQMAAYALAMMQEGGWSEVHVHLLFAERKFAQTFSMTELVATAVVNSIIADSKNPDIPPRACDYCSWCANRMTCPALTKPVEVIASARDDIQGKEQFAAWLAKGAHASELADAQVAGVVLKMARQISDWCDSVEHHCKELAIKQGIVPAGFKIQTRQGNRFIPSVADAFARAGLPQEEFLKACEIKFFSLTETFAKVNGMKKAQAERTVSEKLGDAVQRKASSLSLVAEKIAK